MMNENITQIFDVIKTCLNKQTYQNPIKDEKAFYKVMRENGLQACFYETLFLDSLSSNFSLKLLKEYQTFIFKDTQQLILIEEISNLLSKHQIRHVFLKGSRLKYMYPKTYFRGMGDIDILVDQENLKKMKQIFLEIGIVFINRSEAHDIYQSKQGLDIEVHSGFYSEFVDEYEDLVHHPFQDIIKIDKHRYHLEIHFEFLYLIYHLAKHFHSGGVGIRSLLDIGMYYQYYKKDLKEKVLLERIKSENVLTFVKTILSLNTLWFGIEFEFNFLKDFILSEDLYVELTYYITSSGIHGWGRDHDPMAPRVINKGKKKGKMSLILSRIFLSPKHMIRRYPVLDKCILLLPFVYVYRLFGLIFLKGRKNIKKVKQIKDVDNASEIENLFNKIGL